MQIFPVGNQISTVKYWSSLSPKSSSENRTSLSLYWMMMNRDLGAEDYVEFRWVDATGSLIQLISLHGPDLLFSSGADWCKFPGNLSRGVQRLNCFLPFLAKGSQVKCPLCISWLFVSFAINIYSKCCSLDFFGLHSVLQVNALIFNSSIEGHAALLDSVRSLYF